MGGVTLLWNLFIKFLFNWQALVNSLFLGRTIYSCTNGNISRHGATIGLFQNLCLEDAGLCEYGHDAENAEQIDMMQDSTLLKPFQISNASIPPPSWQPPPFSGKWRYAKIISKLPQASEFHYHGLQNLPASSYIMKVLLKNCYFCCQVNCKLYFHLISL